MITKTHKNTKKFYLFKILKSVRFSQYVHCWAYSWPVKSYANLKLGRPPFTWISTILSYTSRGARQREGKTWRAPKNNRIVIQMIFTGNIFSRMRFYHFTLLHHLGFTEMLPSREFTNYIPPVTQCQRFFFRGASTSDFSRKNILFLKSI